MSKNQSIHGKFITIEGADGAGKSTQALRLKEYLQEKGYETVLTREPGGTRIGEQVREILLNPESKYIDFKTEVLLYAACRSQLLKEVIIPALMDGKIVISDRFVDSSIAYQGYARDIDLSFVKKINRLIVGEFFPDITVFLDVPVQTGLGRNRDKGRAIDRLESEDINFHQRVYDGFKELALKNQRFYIVNGSESEDLVFAEIVKIVAEKLLVESNE